MFAFYIPTTPFLVVPAVPLDSGLCFIALASDCHYGGTTPSPPAAAALTKQLVKGSLSKLQLKLERFQLDFALSM